MNNPNFNSLPPEVYQYYMFRPVAFAETMLLQLTPEEVKANKINRRLEPETKEILRALAEFDYVSVFSGRGCTKTASLAMAIIWWIWTRPDSRVGVTGPKFENLKATLWAEIGKWLSFSALSDEIILTGEKIYHVDPAMQAFGRIMTTKDKENISGWHATHVLWVIDEASNVALDIINTIMGGMNDPENKIIMTGNPTKASGPFFDSHNKDSKYWYKLRFSTEESERKNKIWLEKMQRFPRESDMYRINVLGLPPLGNPKAIISLADCYSARDRTIEIDNYLEMGVDPAREGDNLATISIRQGLKLLEVRCYPKTKGPELIGYILKMLREYRAKTGIKSKVKIKIDDHGIGGPIADELALNETDNIEVVPCLSNSTDCDERYANTATEMWFDFADVINIVELCDDEELIEELSTREWAPASGSKMKVLPKEKQKEILGRSPDRADCVILCYYKGKKKVFERPDGEENIVLSNFTIDWSYEHLTDPSFDGIFPIDILHYAALVLNDDLSIDGLAAIYQHYVDKLWIYAQFHQEHPEPDIISQIVKRQTRKGWFDDDREVIVIGNEKMFSKDEDKQPLAEILLRSDLYVSEPEKYDEYGAIALGVKMYRENRIGIYETLEMARKAIALWMIKSGKPQADKNGFGKALLLILSEVRRRKKEAPKIKAPRDYKPVLKKYNTTNKSPTAWCTR